ncbi:MAG: hypothetical protein AAF702_05010 [Chloroflexota bacterium]
MAVNVSSKVVDLFGNPLSTDGESKRILRPQKRGYRAIEVDDISEGKGNEDWFRVHGDPNDLPNSVELFRYVDLLKVFSPIHTQLMIACQDAVFQIIGRHLGSIPELIQDRKLRGIYLFNSVLHVEPNEAEPVIFELERVSLIDHDSVADDLVK